MHKVRLDQDMDTWDCAFDLPFHQRVCGFVGWEAERPSHWVPVKEIGQVRGLGQPPTLLEGVREQVWRTVPQGLPLCLQATKS